MRYRNLLGILLVSGILLAGCTKKKTEEPAAGSDTTQNFTDKVKAEWEQYKIDVQVLIDSNDARLKRLRDRGEKKLDKTISGLEEQNEALKKRLSEFRADAETNWQQFKNEFDHDMNQLGTAIGDLFKDNVP